MATYAATGSIRARQVVSVDGVNNVLTLDDGTQITGSSVNVVPQQQTIGMYAVDDGAGSFLDTLVTGAFLQVFYTRTGP